MASRDRDSPSARSLLRGVTSRPVGLVGLLRFRCRLFRTARRTREPLDHGGAVGERSPVVRITGVPLPTRALRSRGGGPVSLLLGGLRGDLAVFRDLGRAHLPARLAEILPVSRDDFSSNFSERRKAEVRLQSICLQRTPVCKSPT